ncbi:MAG: hypothetical protein BJ554DRAFT_6514, partial [Olpidium bornovanus]
SLSLSLSLSLIATRAPFFVRLNSTTAPCPSFCVIARMRRPAAAAPAVPSASSGAAVLPLKLYVHVVPSAAIYCDRVRNLERGGGRADFAVDQRIGATAAAEDTDAEKENKGAAASRPPAALAPALDYDPSQHAKLLMVYSGEAATVRDLRVDVLEKYKRIFDKVRKVAYIDHVFDRDLFAIADEYRLRDCFRNGDHVVVIGTRTRIVRMRKSLVTADKATPGRRGIVKKEPSDSKVLVDLNTNREAEDEELEYEANYSVRGVMVEGTVDEGGVDAVEEGVFPDDGRADEAAEVRVCRGLDCTLLVGKTRPFARASLQGDKNVSSTISAGADPAKRKVGYYSHQTRKVTSTTTPVAKVPRRKKPKVMTNGDAEEREFWQHGGPSSLPVAERLASSAGTLIAAKPKKKAKAATGILLT